MEENAKSDINKIFRDILFGKNDKIIEKLIEEYSKAIVSALSLANTPLVMFLYYRFFFNKNKKYTLIAFDKVIDEAHTQISSELIKSIIDDAKDIPFFGEETDELVKQFKEAMGHTRDKIRKGITDSFEEAIRILSAYEEVYNKQTDSPAGTTTSGTENEEGRGEPSGTEDERRRGKPSEACAGEDNK